jgi:hypothetical protein
MRLGREGSLGRRFGVNRKCPRWASFEPSSGCVHPGSSGGTYGVGPTWVRRKVRSIFGTNRAWTPDARMGKETGK